MRSGICGSSAKDIRQLPLEVRNQANSNWFKQFLKTFRLAFYLTFNPFLSVFANRCKFMSLRIIYGKSRYEKKCITIIALVTIPNAA